MTNVRWTGQFRPIRSSDYKYNINDRAVDRELSRIIQSDSPSVLNTIFFPSTIDLFKFGFLGVFKYGHLDIIFSNTWICHAIQVSRHGDTNLFVFLMRTK